MTTRTRGKPRRNRRRPVTGSGSRHTVPPTVWLYGRHAVRAALQNPERNIRRLLVAREAGPGLAEALARILRRRGTARVPEHCARDDLDRLVGAGATHQGVALEADRLPEPDLQQLCQAAGPGTVAVGLDRVTDPQNIGAILRSAAAFEVAFLLMPDRHAPGETAALAKAASGALETVPVVRARRFAHTLGMLGGAGFVRLGLEPGASDSLASAMARVEAGCPIAIVLGAEGSGLRPRTRANCDSLVSIPMRNDQGSLNVSAAAAVALYEVRRRGA